MPGASGSLPDAAFYFDLASPECYLAAERVMRVLPATIEWQPVCASSLAGERQAADRGAARVAIEQRASALGLQPLRWPAEYPFDSKKAMLVATYAKAIGRGVAFAQAAFRQAFAGGHSLADDDCVLIAAAACEMHPAAVVRAIGQRSVRDQLEHAGAAAVRAGIARLPSVRIDGLVFAGEQSLDRAGAHAEAGHHRLRRKRVAGTEALSR